MKKVFLSVLCFLIMFSNIVFLVSCKDEENDVENEEKTISMEKISQRLYELDEQKKIGLEDVEEDEALYWTYEINEELERYNKTPLQGEVLQFFYTEDETYVMEFESIADASAAMTVLDGWQNEHRYTEWQIFRRGKIVFFGEKATLDLIFSTDRTETIRKQY